MSDRATPHVRKFLGQRLRELLSGRHRRADVRKAFGVLRTMLEKGSGA